MIELLSLRSMDTFNFEITPVLEKCKMIDFAMKHIENYDPDSGYGYFQFSKENEEYVSPKTEVVLVGEVSIIICLLYTICICCTSLIFLIIVLRFRIRNKDVLVQRHVKLLVSVIKENF